MFDCVSKTPLFPVKKKTNYLIRFYIILYNFINCPVFIDFGLESSNTVNIIRDIYFLCVDAFCLFPISQLGKVFQCLFQTVFFYLVDKKQLLEGCQTKSSVRRVVVLSKICNNCNNSNNCMGICLGGLSIGRLRPVSVLKRWLFELV